MIASRINDTNYFVYLFGTTQTFVNIEYDDCFSYKKNKYKKKLTMSKRKNRIENNAAEADMTAMLDIVFILLIFFVVTTSFVKEQDLMVNRPKMNKSQNPSAAA